MTGKMLWNRNRIIDKQKIITGSSSQIGELSNKHAHQMMVSPPDEMSLQFSDSKYKIDFTTTATYVGNQLKPIIGHEFSEEFKEIQVDSPESVDKDVKVYSKYSSTKAIDKKSQMRISGFAIDEGSFAGDEQEPESLVLESNQPMRTLTNQQKLKLIATKSKTTNNVEKWLKSSAQRLPNIPKIAAAKNKPKLRFAEEDENLRV